MLFLQINLGRTIAEKFGSTGKTCLGGAAFRNDYLTDVATGSDKSPVKAQKRCVIIVYLMVSAAVWRLQCDVIAWQCHMSVL
jgi:hypothetical protein